MVLREVENNKLSKEDSGYTIKTETTFSDCIVGDGIILALSKERKQLIKYSDKMDIISVESMKHNYYSSFSVKEYRFKDIIFLDFFFDEYRHELMMLTKGEAEWIEWQLKDGTKRVSGLDNIYQVDKYKYIVDIEVCDDYFKTYQEIIAEIELKNKQAKEMFDIRTEEGYSGFYHPKQCLRFMFHCQYNSYDRIEEIIEIFDLYTGFRYKLPKGHIIEEDIFIEYSSKEIIVLQIKKKYYVYVNGYSVYEYTSEEHDTVLYNLKNKKEKYSYGHTPNSQNDCTIELFTVPIGKQLCSWIKGGEPILRKL